MRARSSVAERVLPRESLAVITPVPFAGRRFVVLVELANELRVHAYLAYHWLTGPILDPAL